MARDSLTAFCHKGRDEIVMSLYKDDLGVYVELKYSGIFYLRDIGMEPEEFTVGPECMVTWK